MRKIGFRKEEISVINWRKSFFLLIFVQIILIYPFNNTIAFPQFDNSEESGLFILNTYLGGSNIDEGKSIAFDSSGNIIIVGDTESSDFPIVNGYDSSYDETYGTDIFITKITREGSIIWSTYHGGSSYDHVNDVAIDSNDNIIIVGSSSSLNFPVVNAFDSKYNKRENIIISKFSSEGSIIWSTYFGEHDYSSSLEATGLSVSIDSDDNIIITGSIGNYDIFTSDKSFDSTHGGLKDAFIAKFSPNGNLLWSTYLGGSEYDAGTSIAVDNVNNIIITGVTRSNDFSGFEEGLEDIDFTQLTFTMKFTSNGSMIWGSVSGQGSDYSSDVGIDSENNVIITGSTPTSVWYSDVFLKKLSAENGKLMWNTSFGGGSSNDRASCITIDIEDNIILAGVTESSYFPIKYAFDSEFGNDSFGIGIDEDSFVSKFSSNGNLLWSTFLGENFVDHQPQGIIVDNDKNVLVTGFSTTTSWNNDDHDIPILYFHDPIGDPDDDGMFNVYESQNDLLLFVNDANEDKDSDGLTNFEEFQLGTAANSEDTDQDGYSDKEELEAGTDPLDKYSYPVDYSWLFLIIILIIILITVSIVIGLISSKIMKQPLSKLPINIKIRQLDKMTGKEFEQFLENLFQSDGYQVETVAPSGDHGVDLVIVKDKARIGVQAKRYKPPSKVGNNVLIKLKGGGHFYDCEKLMVVTTSYFSLKAIEYAEKVGIELWNRDVLEKHLTRLTQQQIILEKREEETQLEKLLLTSQEKYSRALHEIKIRNYLQAKKLFENIKQDLQLAEKKVNFSLVKQKIQKQLESLNLEQKIHDMKVLDGYFRLVEKKKDLQKLVQKGKLAKALQNAERLVEGLKKTEAIAGNYDSHLKASIHQEYREINQFSKNLEVKLSEFIDEIAFPRIEPSPLHPTSLPEEERIFCQLCQEYYPKKQPYYECKNCGRQECLNCYVKSVETGKNTCVFCDGQLQSHEMKTTRSNDK